MITRPALPGELSTDAPRLGFPRPARVPVIECETCEGRGCVPAGSYSWLCGGEDADCPDCKGTGDALPGLVDQHWGPESLPTAADIRELATRYETERPAYAAHGCSVEYTVESLVEDLRCERDEEFRAELAAEEREY